MTSYACAASVGAVATVSINDTSSTTIVQRLLKEGREADSNLDPANRRLTVAEWSVFLDHWVSELDRDLPNDYEPIEIDCLFDSGGCRGYYFCAIVHYLLHGKRYRVVESAGASAGAGAALAVMSGVDIPRYIVMYHDYLQPRVLQHGLSILDAFSEIVDELLPEDAHRRCNNRVHIAAHEVVSFRDGGMKHATLSEFHTREELKQACRCSMAIPALTMRESSQMFRGREYLDGVVAHIPKPVTRPRLFFNLSRIEYVFAWKLSPQDPNIGRLVLQAMNDWEYFLKRQNPYIRPSSSPSKQSPSKQTNDNDNATNFTNEYTTKAQQATQEHPVVMDLYSFGLENDETNNLPIYWTHHPRSHLTETEYKDAKSQRIQRRILRVGHGAHDIWERIKMSRPRVLERGGLLRSLFGSHEDVGAGIGVGVSVSVNESNHRMASTSSGTQFESESQAQSQAKSNAIETVETVDSSVVNTLANADNIAINGVNVTALKQGNNTKLYLSTKDNTKNKRKGKDGR